MAATVVDSKLQFSTAEQATPCCTPRDEGATFHDDVPSLDEASKGLITSHCFLLLRVPIVESLKRFLLGLKHERNIAYRLDKGV
jgi:hypothetical protein